jgi:putative membrane protein
MSNDTQRTARFLKSWAINTLAVLLAVKIAPGLHFSPTSPYAAPILTALVLGILNAFIRPILMLLALPLLIFTLGLFTLVINALLLCMVAWLLGPDYFRVDSFGAAFIGAIIISIVSVALNIMTGGARVSVRKGPPPPPRPPGRSGPDGDGPVIDV